MKLTTAQRRALGMDSHRSPREQGATLLLGIIVDVIDEPSIRKDDVLDVIERGMSGKRAPNGWLQRCKGRSEVQATIDGKMTYRGRACCFERLYRLEEELVVRHDLPFNITCPACQTVYRIRRGVIGGRR